MVGQQLDKEKKEVLEKIRQKKEDRLDSELLISRWLQSAGQLP